MKYRTRTNYTPEQKTQMWDRREKGDSLYSIARLFDRGHSSVFGQLSPTSFNPCRDKALRPVRESTHLQVAPPIDKTRQSVCRRADTSSHRF